MLTKQFTHNLKHLTNSPPRRVCLIQITIIMPIKSARYQLQNPPTHVSPPWLLFPSNRKPSQTNASQWRQVDNREKAQMMLGATTLSTRCCKCSPILMWGSQSNFNARGSQRGSSTQSTSFPQQPTTSDGKNTVWSGPQSVCWHCSCNGC